EEFFCFTYGDGLADVNIREEIEFHKKHGKLVTALAVRHPARYAEWKVEDDGKVEIVAQPREEFGWFCGGFFVVSKEALKFIKGDQTDWNLVLFELNKKDELRGFKHYGFWYSMETLKDRAYLQDLWKSGKAPWKLW
ncbi:MAG: glucose-1-phosphate cytidylyltransferase, partial [Thermodesulfobacteria bacterium]|nr:glucose-1-phosphate cytidylyltransferase [Thermodesulfobacteriota bacterium]